MTTVPTAGTQEIDAPSTEQEAREDAGGGCGCGGCGCGGGGGQGVQITGRPSGADEVQPGDLDVRPLAPATRHERVVSAVAGLLPGEALVLAADHDPRPLRHQLDTEHPGEIGWEYLAEGPAVWRVLVSRVSCC